MPLPYDLTGNKVSFTYPRLIQVVSGSYYDGVGNALNLGDSSSVLSSSYALTASYAQTSSVALNGLSTITSQITSLGSIITLYSQPTNSYNNIWFDYGINDGVSNARCGTIMACWFNNTASYTEYTTTDIGNTSDVLLSVSLSGSYIQLQALTNITNNWNIKALVRYL